MLMALMPVARAQTPDQTATPAPQAPAETSAPVETPTAQPERVEENSKPRFRIGPEVGLFLPTDSTTRDRFGSSWLALGVGFGQLGTIPKNGALSLDLHFFYHKNGDNHAFLAPIGLGYVTALSDAETNVPYAGASADLLLADINSNQDDVHSGLRTGGGASAFLGVHLSNSAYAEARYYLIGKVKGLDFSGLSLAAGYRF
jgi:hypothetical protein